MDFFAVQDLCKVVEFCINRCAWERIDGGLDINCVYPFKYTLVDVAKMAGNKNIISGNMSEYSYTGNPNKLQELKIPLIGLENGIEILRSHIERRI
jgi:hypothetical protein